MTSGVGESDVSSALVRQVQGPEGATSGRVEYEKMEYAFVDRLYRRRGPDTDGAHLGRVTVTWRSVRAMEANARLICSLVCGEGHSVAQGVMTVSPAYKFSTLARFRDALDGLVEGMKKAKKR